MHHIPVMQTQVVEGLQINPQGTYWDGTFGQGGHSALILEGLGPDGHIYGSDRDEAGREASARFSEEPRFRFLRGTLAEVLGELPAPLDGFLWDLGCSTGQLKQAERGFSFNEDGPLDMRMDTSQELTAADLVNGSSEKELADLIYKYGEERLSRRIAARVVVARREAPITTTAALAEICRRSYPRKHHRIHPATRTFQALRIAVNDELGQIETTLPLALERLAGGGRAVVISFHSLEDRIVKHTFRAFALAGGFRLITKKPLVADEGERQSNPASRSAKLRVIERFRGGDE